MSCSQSVSYVVNDYRKYTELIAVKVGGLLKGNNKVWWNYLMLSSTLSIRADFNWASPCLRRSGASLRILPFDHVEAVGSVSHMGLSP